MRWGFMRQVDHKHPVSKRILAYLGTIFLKQLEPSLSDCLNMTLIPCLPASKTGYPQKTRQNHLTHYSTTHRPGKYDNGSCSWLRHHTGIVRVCPGIPEVRKWFMTLWSISSRLKDHPSTHSMSMPSSIWHWPRRIRYSVTMASAANNHEDLIWLTVESHVSIATIYPTHRWYTPPTYGILW